MRGVIFDVDGVLVDSYDAHLESWRRLAAETGTQFTQQQFIESFGRTSREIIAKNWPASMHGSATIEQLDLRKEAIYREIVAAHFPAMDGAHDLVQRLHRRPFRIALGSSGPPENVRLAIEQLKIAEFIDAIVTGEDVARGKPDPQIFLLAADRLCVRARDCCVIEDAPAGVQAAQAAGMTVIAMLSRGRARADFHSHSPDRFVESLREISAAMINAIIDQRIA